MIDLDPTTDPRQPSWYCHWCGSLDAGYASQLQPAFCGRCVQRMLEGTHGENERAASPWLLRQRRTRAQALALGLTVLSGDSSS